MATEAGGEPKDCRTEWEDCIPMHKLQQIADKAIKQHREQAISWPVPEQKQSASKAAEYRKKGQQA